MTAKPLPRPDASVAPRVVLDTNVALSALVFPSGSAGRLRLAWHAERFTPLVCTATAQELVRVLAYPKFRLSATDREELLADYLPWCATVMIPNPPPRVPVCRDPFDTVFLHLATVGKATALVSGDRDLLVLAGQTTVPVLTLDIFLITIIKP